VSALAGSAANGHADISLRFGPVVDGHALPAHPFEPAASELSATVPLMVGSNECEAVPYGNPDDPYWTKEPADIPELRPQVKRVVSANDVSMITIRTIAQPDNWAASTVRERLPLSYGAFGFEKDVQCATGLLFSH